MSEQEQSTHEDRSSNYKPQNEVVLVAGSVGSGSCGHQAEFEIRLSFLVLFVFTHRHSSIPSIPIASMILPMRSFSSSIASM